MNRIVANEMFQDDDGNKEPFIVHCGTCLHQWTAAYLPQPIDVFVKLAKSPCPMCGAEKVQLGGVPKVTAEGDPLAWIAGGDTGVSSKTIWRVLMGRDCADDRSDVPYDPADFGRCYRLLEAMPAWRQRLPEVAAKFPRWRPLVEAWDELTALYEEELPKGTAPKLYQRMKELCP